ncbi:hypothetical protein D3C78_1069030 [compost metagenome]
MKKLGQEELITRIKDALEQRESIAAQVGAGLSQVERKIDVYRDVVARMLTKAAGN